MPASREHRPVRCGVDERCENRAGVDGGRNTVQTDIFQRMAVDGDAPNRDDRAVLLHANDRVIALIGDIEIRALIQGRVARPVDVVHVPVDGRQVDRQV